MQQLRSDFVALALLFTSLFALPFTVFAADSHTVPAYGSLQVDEHGICRVVNNNNGSVLFVPTRTSNEWQVFVTAGGNSQIPGVSLSSCAPGAPSCVPNQGQSCNSSQNACGMTNQGTVQCDGSCSASAPSNDACGGGGGGSSCNEVLVCDYMQQGSCYCPYGGFYDEANGGCVTWECGENCPAGTYWNLQQQYCEDRYGEYFSQGSCELIVGYQPICSEDQCLAWRTECQ